MGLLFFVLFGLIVGLIARAIMPGRQPMGLVVTAVLGMGGSILGGFVASALSGRPAVELHAAGFIGSVIGALVLLAIGGGWHHRRSFA